MFERISIVIPIFNEDEILVPTIEGLTARLQGMFGEHEIVLTENGSSDNTKELARGLAGRIPTVRAVIDDGPADYGQALVLGINACSHDECAVLELDYLDLEFLARGYEMLSDYDLVVGSKALNPAMDQRGLKRRALTYFYNLALRWGTGLRLSDTHGLKVFRKSSVIAIVNSCVTRHAVYQSEFVIRAERSLRVAEIPLSMPLREIRTTRISATRRLKATLDDLMLLRRALRGG